MSKFYFRDSEAERCYTKDAIIQQMKDEGISELTVYEAERETSTGYFFCNNFLEVGEVRESCGKLCEAYKPNNGKNGRCKFYGYVYNQTNNTKVIRT